MPVLANNVRGKDAGLFMRYLGASETYPTPVDIVVAAPGADAGDLLIPTAALPAAVPKNTVLTFNAGTVNETSVVVTADAALGAVSLVVDNLVGRAGAGISKALVALDEAEWDTLLTFAGSDNMTFGSNTQRQNLGGALHGEGTDVRILVPEITSASPNIQVEGILSPDNPLVADIIAEMEGSNSRWAVRATVPKGAGLMWFSKQGIAVLDGGTVPVPAGDLVRFSFELAWIARPLTVMLDGSVTS
jgi:hypothetical protein